MKRIATTLVLSALLCGVAFAQELSIIPRPVSLTRGNGEFPLQATTTISTTRETRELGRRLADDLRSTGLVMKVTGQKRQKDAIDIALDKRLERLSTEGYRIEITPDLVTIRAAAAAGIFYAMQTLKQMLPAQIYSSTPQSGVEWKLPAATIEDYPRFKWRGAMMDVSRHFMPKATVLKFIDLMALHKLNTFHWHLTDDQGWRIEIKRYPKLTSVGSMRKESRVGHERDKKGFDGTPHGGFYTQQEVREVVAYARERFITVVPEIEMPGHAQAALAAYPELGNTSEKLEVGTVWGIYNHVFNADEPTIIFLQNVLKEVMKLFPSEFIHVGGDEVKKDEWKANPNAQALMKEKGFKDEHELQSYFIQRMDKFLTAHGRRLIGWDEILEGGLAPGATVMSWRGNKGGIAAAKAGHDVVMAPNSHTYFDFYQSRDRDEPLAIGGFLPIEKVYEFNPVPPELSKEEQVRVLGGQCQLWSEYIATPAHLEYMAFPRISALAECVWTPVERKDYQSFQGRIEVQKQRYRVLGVNFRDK